MINILILTVIVECIIYIYGAKRGVLPCIFPEHMEFCG